MGGGKRRGGWGTLESAPLNSCSLALREGQYSVFRGLFPADLGGRVREKGWGRSGEECVCKGLSTRWV